MQITHKFIIAIYLKSNNKYLLPTEWFPNKCTGPFPFTSLNVTGGSGNKRSSTHWLRPVPPFNTTTGNLISDL